MTRAFKFTSSRFLNCSSLKLVSTVKQGCPRSIKDAKVIESEPEWIQEILGS